MGLLLTTLSIIHHDLHLMRIRDTPSIGGTAVHILLYQILEIILKEMYPHYLHFYSVVYCAHSLIIELDFEIKSMFLTSMFAT